MLGSPQCDQESHVMTIRKLVVALALGAMSFAEVPAAKAEDWGRFYHYPYSYFPFNYRKPFASEDFDLRYGYPMYPQYMAHPPYFRKDLYYPFHTHMKGGNNVKAHHQGLHYTLDVF
jgi:hypothetical protein